MKRLGAKPVAIQLPIGSDRLQGHHRSGPHEGASSGKTRRLARSTTSIEIPDDMKAKAHRVSCYSGRSRRRTRRRRSSPLFSMARSPIKRLRSISSASRCLKAAWYPDALGLSVQEQGRAASARRRRRLSAEPDRPVPPSKAWTWHDPEKELVREFSRQPADGRCLPSRSWTTRSSAPLPSAASIPAY